MNEQEYKNVDAFVQELNVMKQAVCLVCDAEVAADICLKTTKAIRLINSLIKEIEDLKAV